MIAFRNMANLATSTLKLQSKQVMCFSDSWRDRDEAAEKVYITRN